MGVFGRGRAKIVDDRGKWLGWDRGKGSGGTEWGERRNGGGGWEGWDEGVTGVKGGVYEQGDGELRRGIEGTSASEWEGEVR